VGHLRCQCGGDDDQAVESVTETLGPMLGTNLYHFIRSSVIGSYSMPLAVPRELKPFEKLAQFRELLPGEVEVERFDQLLGQQWERSLQEFQPLIGDGNLYASDVILIRQARNQIAFLETVQHR
jgi:hypothetical protein